MTYRRRLLLLSSIPIAWQLREEEANCSQAPHLRESHTRRGMHWSCPRAALQKLRYGIELDLDVFCNHDGVFFWDMK